MDSIKLMATRREVTGKKVKALRREGLLPAVLYGHSLEPTPISLDMREASHVLGTLGSSSILKIDLEGEELNALVRDRQRDYLKGIFLHIDFQVVSMTEKIRANVSIHIIGTSPALQEFNAIVEQLINEIEVESLPGNLPEKFEVDVSGLAEIGDQILVKDLTLPEGVTISLDPEETIVTIASATVEVEAEEEEIEEEILDEPEVIEKGKRDEEDEETGS
jgi:large subunit ribosomal protein L25